jgi:hypothetical protein
MNEKQVNIKSIKAELVKYNSKQSAEGKLKKAEIPVVKKPSKNEFLPFPEDLSEVPGEDLGKYIGVYEAQLTWIGYCIARVEIDLEYARTLLGYVYSKIFSRLRETATIRKAIVLSDEFYLQCQKEVLEVEVDLKMLRASYEMFEHYSKAVSREITNRHNLILSGRRADIP